MNIGLVLSGGMAKGAYQIGALKAINEFIPPEGIKCISSSSVGVLNSYAFYNNRLNEAKEIWINSCNHGERMLISKMLRSTYLQQSIKSIFSEQDVIKNDFFITLFDSKNRIVEYKNIKTVKNNSLLDYLKASVAMPIYNKSIYIGGKSYYDGAMIDNIPILPLLEKGLDLVICIYFDDCCYKFENDSFDKKVIKITFPINNVLTDSILIKRVAIEDMIDKGYEITRFTLKSVLGEGNYSIDAIYKNIEYLNNQYKNKKMRITGDVMVTNLNKITKKITKKRIT